MSPHAAAGSPPLGRATRTSPAASPPTSGSTSSTCSFTCSAGSVATCCICAKTPAVPAIWSSNAPACAGSSPSMAETCPRRWPGTPQATAHSRSMVRSSNSRMALPTCTPRATGRSSTGTDSASTRCVPPSRRSPTCARPRPRPAARTATRSLPEVPPRARSAWAPAARVWATRAWAARAARVRTPWLWAARALAEIHPLASRPPRTQACIPPRRYTTAPTSTPPARSAQEPGSGTSATS